MNIVNVEFEHDGMRGVYFYAKDIDVVDGVINGYSCITTPHGTYCRPLKISESVFEQQRQSAIEMIGEMSFAAYGYAVNKDGK